LRNPVFSGTAVISSVADQQESPTTSVEQADALIDVSLKNRCKRFGSLLRHFLLRTYTVETIFDGERINLLIADDGTTLCCFRELLPEGSKIRAVGWINALNGPGLNRSDADVVIVGANQLLTGLYEKHGFRIVPKWVKLYLPVREEPYSRLYNKGRQARKYFKWMIKKSADAGFECEISTDRAVFDHFYHKMYRPYALQRFGERAVVYDYAIVDRSFKRGAVAIVKQNGKSIAGTVIYRRGDVLHLPHTGVVEDGMEAVRAGAAFALDYYLAHYAHSEGCSFVDFGHSRPFLLDGTLKYKLNWHMNVLPDDDSMGVFAIISPNNSPQAAKFLAAHPHFHLAEGRCTLSDD
jgi:hypothetical protein